MSRPATLRVRLLGRISYQAARDLQQTLWSETTHNYLLLLEHDPVYTLGVRAKLDDVLVTPADVGAEMVAADRGGQVTYHGPGQLVGYPIVSVPVGPQATPRYTYTVEQLVIDALADLGLPGCTRKEKLPGVWIDDRKICAIGTRVSRGRSMHGFAINVSPDMSMFDHIVPCGIREFGVTSLALEHIDVTMADVIETVIAHAVPVWGPSLERSD